MYNTAALAMLLAYLNLSDMGGTVEPMPLWMDVITIICVCVLLCLLGGITYSLISELIEEYKQKKRRKELWKK